MPGAWEERQTDPARGSPPGVWPERPHPRRWMPTAAVATSTFLEPDPVTRSRPADPANASPHPPTEVVPPHPPTEVVPPHGVCVTQSAGRAEPATESLRHPGRPPGIVRYGPGVPATPHAGGAELTAERVWRTGGLAVASRRPARLRRLLGSALTVILLAASGIVLYLRFYHAPFHVARHFRGQ